MASTRLKYIFSKDINILVRSVEALPFKIEIKGSPQFQNGKWFLFFTVDESDTKAFGFRSGEIK